MHKERAAMTLQQTRQEESPAENGRGNNITTEKLRKVKLNCNIGCNSEDAYYTEMEKIRRRKESGYIPDMMMDLSLFRAEKPLYNQILEY